MAAGDLALVLHAHLPYVRSGEPGSLEEDWYFQALQECYLPLVALLEAAAADPDQRPKLTLGLSPTLLSLLSDRDLNDRFPGWLAQRRALLEEAPTDQGPRPVRCRERSGPSRPSGGNSAASSCPGSATCRSRGFWI